jgi:uncharacterized membrane protein YecN with MAPEG domain
MTALHLPSVTLLAASLLAIIFAVLSALVVVQRGRQKIMIGSGEAPGAGAAAGPLLVAVRAQANFAEYVPLSLLLIGLIELRTGTTLVVQLLAGGMVLARVLHPVGMHMKAPNPFRAAGFILSLLVLVAGAVAGLLALA